MMNQSENTENTGKAWGATIVLDNRLGGTEAGWSDTSLAETRDGEDNSDVPEKIRQMIRLYEYGDGSIKRKCRNFYRQGKFMEDYEDDAPWNGEFSRYFPTYHDLSIPKLRGYFTWRTNVRKGIYRPIATSLAYIYLYELLNGIGTSSPEESLWKMQEFETEYLDTGIGDWMMTFNLHRWMLEFAIIHQLPKKLAITFASPDKLESDQKIAVLRNPENHTDEEVCDALCLFVTGKIETSPVLTRDSGEGRHLFAEVWRHTMAHYNHDGKDLLTSCFGPWKPFPWHPLANSVYFETRDLTDFDYELDECRIYQYREGRWFVQTYEEMLYNKKIINALLHEADRLLRVYLKTGRNLRAKPEEAWATPYVEAVIEADRQAKIEAAKPKVNINLDSLSQIRQDAVVTRESLLTDEDRAEATTAPMPVEVIVAEPVADCGSADDNDFDYKDGNDDDNDNNNGPDVDTVRLDPIHRQILLALLAGGSPDELIRTHRLIPSVVTDTLNEAFYDEIGDSILDCDEDQIRLVEDYVDDVKEILAAIPLNLKP